MIVHQIWIGHKPAPEEWMVTVKDFCKAYGHTYMFWGNDDVKRLDLSKYPGIQELMDEYEKRENSYKYAGQADILRTVILYEHGGIYVDSDSVIVNEQRFDRFLREMSSQVFYAWENDEGLIANGVIGCPKGHGYMKQCLDMMPTFAAERKDKPVWERTGPYFVTAAYNQYKGQYPGEMTIVPKHYFYPQDWHGIDSKDAHKGKTYDPDTMMFQYGYTTNNMGSHFGGMDLWKKILLSLAVILVLLVIFTKAGAQAFQRYILKPVQKIGRR